MASIFFGISEGFSGIPPFTLVDTLVEIESALDRFSLMIGIVCCYSFQMICPFFGGP